MQQEDYIDQGTGMSLRGFVGLVVVLFVVAFASVVVITQFSDSEGTMEFSYDGFG